MGSRGNKLEGTTLLPASHTPLALSQYQGKSFAHQLLERLRLGLEETGDRRWLTNGALQTCGKSNVLGRESYSLGQVEPRCLQMARGLHHKLGFRKGDVAHLVMPGNTEMYFPVIAAWLLQGVVSPADPGLKAEVLALQIKEVKAKVVFCCRATLEKVREAVGLVSHRVTLVILDGDNNSTKGDEMSLECLIDEGDNDTLELPQAETVEEDELMMIMWSSGTTGRPKGIMHGPKMPLRILDGKASFPGTILQTTCFFHLGGFLQPLNSLMTREETVFIAPEDLDDDIALLLKVARKNSASNLVCGSHHLIQLAALRAGSGESADTIKMICPLGANLYEGIIDDLKDKFPAARAVLNVYGQSEGGAAVSVSVTQANLGDLHCPAVRVIDPDTGEPLGPNMVGEIVYKTNAVMLGYLNHPEENNKFFGPDGFCHSGDLGHYDENAVLFYDGRLKELIKYKNFHLYPNELEELLLSHEAVEDVAVFGKHEASVQELVTALVVKRNDSKVSEQELVKFADEKVDDHKKIRGGVHFVEKIPKNPQGKILRKNLLALIN